MKLRHRLLSLITSLALAFGLSANALAAPAKNAEQPAPAITLTADKTSVNLGDTVSVKLSIDGTTNGFSSITAKVSADAALKPTQVTAVESVPGFSNYEAPELLSKGTFSNLVLSSKSVQNKKLNDLATYTFTANKTGSYTISVSGDFSADGKGNTATVYSDVSPVTITVSAKALTASVAKNATLSGTYGDDLVAKITDQTVTFQDGGKTV